MQSLTPLPGLPPSVLTHHVPDHAPHGESHYAFVSDDVESAIEQAKAAAGDKNASLMGASIPQPCLRVGLRDEGSSPVVPLLLGCGVRLFDHLGSDAMKL